MIPCPACGEPLGSGQAQCPSCRAPRLLARSDDDARPACAFHTERVASAACAHCGRFGCAVCLADCEDGVLLCRGCRQATRARRLPWDDRSVSLVRGFARSAWRLAFRPSEALAGADRDGGLGSSMLFATLASLPLLASHAAALLVYLRFFDETPPDAELAAIIVTAMELLIVGFVAGWLLLLPALDWMVLRLMGSAPRAYRSHVRASALALAPMTLGVVPVLGLLVLPVWSFWLKACAYRAFDRNTRAEAAVGAVSGLVLIVAIAIALRLDVRLAAFMQR